MEEKKYNFCIIFCCVCVLLSFITLITTTLTINELVMKHGKLDSKLETTKVEVVQLIEQQNNAIREQYKIIEDYKKYVDNVSKCIVNGEW